MILGRAVLLSLYYAFTLCLSEEKPKDTRKGCSKTGLPLQSQPRARVDTSSRLTGLRNIMKTRQLQAYIITSTDEHMNYETDDYDKRLQYISGFSGTYGIAVVTENKSALWVDNRYHLQADEQLSCHWLLFRDGYKHFTKITEWLKKELTRGSNIGTDAKLISEYLWKKLQTELNGVLNIKIPETNLVDLIWLDKERKRQNKNDFVLDEALVGRKYNETIIETRLEIQKHGIDALVITALDEIAWLLNIRGQDLPYSPLVRSYVILDTNDLYLYVENDSNPKELTFDKSIVQIKNYTEFWRDLADRSQLYGSMLVPTHCTYSEGASHAVVAAIKESTVIFKPSPILYMKAVKTKAEVDGMFETSIKDAARLCEFLADLEEQMKSEKSLTEFEVVKQLIDYRSMDGNWLSSSRPIVAFGSNAAHPFYKSLENDTTTIFQNNSVIIETGVHYLHGNICGTTLVARTLHFGEPSEEIKAAYTRALIGLIQFSTLTFPGNMRMAIADTLVRSSLWEVGKEYFHDSGHGIGAYLGIKESPIMIRYDSDASLQQTFKPNYFLSIEPGFYQEGEFGVKIGNVMHVIEKSWLKHSGHTFLGFKLVTLLPFEPKLFKLSILSPQQRQWLNQYNELIRQYVGAELKAEKKMKGFYWMMEKTKYIPETGRGCIIYSQSLLLIMVNIGLVKFYIV